MQITDSNQRLITPPQHRDSLDIEKKKKKKSRKINLTVHFMRDTQKLIYSKKKVHHCFRINLSYICPCKNYKLMKIYKKRE